MLYENSLDSVYNAGMLGMEMNDVTIRQSPT